MKVTITFLALLILASCSNEDGNSKYLRWVGDSVYNAELDTSEFQLCNRENAAKQYFHFNQGLQYKGEKEAIRNIFRKKYAPVDTKQSGFVRIRFVVNCKGEKGRFRIIGSDQEYQEQIFDKRITSQLLSITQSLEEWALQSTRGKPNDYYQYLIFKIDNGSIIDIMP